MSDQIEPKIKKKEKEMGFFDHIEELRWHLIRSIIALLVITILAFLNKSLIADGLIFAPTKISFPTYKILCWISEQVHISAICLDFVNFRIISLNLAGQFMAHLQASLTIGFIVAFPYIFWEFWRFLRPALYDSEAKYSKGIIFSSSLLFFIGVSFGYFVLLPFAFNFFGSYSFSGSISNDFSLTNYMGFFTMFVLASGILFELPMVVYFLSKLGIVTPEMMRSHRKHSLIVILLISAIITPADVGTQILVAIPVLFLYEFSIFISARVARNREKEFLAS